jgi:hypothetical protein
MARIEFLAPARLLNMNDKAHWSKRSPIVAEWRKAAWAHAVNAKLGQLGPSIVTVALPVKGNIRRDPHNFTPTLKAIIDGLVDAKLWPDDNSNWVSTEEPSLCVGARFVVVSIRPREPLPQGA